MAASQVARLPAAIDSSPPTDDTAESIADQLLQQHLRTLDPVQLMAACDADRRAADCAAATLWPEWARRDSLVDDLRAALARHHLGRHISVHQWRRLLRYCGQHVRRLRLSGHHFDSPPHGGDGAGGDASVYERRCVNVLLSTMELCAQLQELHLIELSLDAHSLIRRLANSRLVCGQLRSVRLYAVHGLSDSLWPVVRDHWPLLHHVHLADLDANVSVQLLRSCRALRSLSIDNCGGVDAPRLLELIWRNRRSLQQLRLCGLPAEATHCMRGGLWANIVRLRPRRLRTIATSAAMLGDRPQAVHCLSGLAELRRIDLCMDMAAWPVAEWLGELALAVGARLEELRVAVSGVARPFAQDVSALRRFRALRVLRVRNADAAVLGHLQSLVLPALREVRVDTWDAAAMQDTIVALVRNNAALRELRCGPAPVWQGGAQLPWLALVQSTLQARGGGELKLELRTAGDDAEVVHEMGGGLVVRRTSGPDIADAFCF